MIKLNAGNVLLKPSLRRQLMTWLRRSLKLGSRLGNFALTITLRRTGRVYDVRANVTDTSGGFDCHTRRYDWRTAIRDLTRVLTARLHQQCLRRAAIA